MSTCMRFVPSHSPSCPVGLTEVGPRMPTRHLLCDLVPRRSTTGRARVASWQRDHSGWMAARSSSGARWTSDQRCRILRPSTHRRSAPTRLRRVVGRSVPESPCNRASSTRGATSGSRCAAPARGPESLVTLLHLYHAKKRTARRRWRSPGIRRRGRRLWRRWPARPTRRSRDYSKTAPMTLVVRSARRRPLASSARTGERSAARGAPPRSRRIALVQRRDAPERQVHPAARHRA